LQTLFLNFIRDRIVNTNCVSFVWTLQYKNYARGVISKQVSTGVYRHSMSRVGVKVRGYD